MFENLLNTLLVTYLIGFCITGFILGYKWTRDDNSIYDFNPSNPVKCFVWPIIIVMEILDFPYKVGGWIDKKVRVNRIRQGKTNKD